MKRIAPLKRADRVVTHASAPHTDYRAAMRRTLSAGTALLVGATSALLLAVPADGVLVVTGRKKIVSVSASTDRASLVDLALSADGTRATAVWVSNLADPDNPWAHGPYEVRSASATIAGSTARWGSPVTVGTSERAIEQVDVGLNADGTVAVAAWSGESGFGGPYAVDTATAAVDGLEATWTDQVRLSAPEADAMSPTVQVSGSGTRALVAWANGADTGWSVNIAAASISGGEPTWRDGEALWTPSEVDAYYQYVSNLTAVMTADGSRLALAWAYQSSASEVRVESIVGAISGNTTTWGAVDVVASGITSVNSLRFATSADITKATAVWDESDNTEYTLRSASADVSGVNATWGTPEQIADPQPLGFYPNLAISSAGTRAVMSWQVASVDSWGDPATSTMVAGGTVVARDLRLGDAEQVSPEEASVFAPRLVASSDGTRVVMTWLRRLGTNELPRNQVQMASFSIDGTEISPVDTWSLTRQTVHAAGPTVAITADATRATALWNTDFEYDVVQGMSTTLEYRGDPKVTAVTPSSGPLDGGNTVTITGENFYDVIAVTFGFDEVDEADITVLSPTRIRVVVPEGEVAGRVSVTVETASGETKRNKAYTYLKVADPTITDISPAVGGLAGGAEITITGTRLSNLRDIFFGSEDAPFFELVSATKVIVTIPRGKALGPVPITIKTTSGSVTRPDAFTYVVVPPKPTAVDAELDGRKLTVTWDAPRGDVRGFIVTCVKGDTEITRTVSARSETATVTVPSDALAGEGAFTCQVAATGPGGAQGQFSRPDRATMPQ